MIQELLKNANLLQEERKISLNGVFQPPLPLSSTTTPPTTATTTTAAATATTPSSTSENNQNLRCPRCDSPNTKFCYYNNYNLTQPRHFCKTCRRYWTKGGALRNVPIGGGCRKTKNTSISATIGKSSKLKNISSDIGIRSDFINGFDPNSHIFSLIKSNPNPNTNFISEHVNARAMGYDPLHHLPSLGLSTTSWRNNQHQNGVVLGEVQNNGIQGLYHKLKSSSNYYYNNSNNNSQFVLSNVPPATSSAVLESAPVTGGEMGYWNNPALSWSDLTTTNGAYP